MNQQQLEQLVETFENELYNNPAYAGDNIGEWFNYCEQQLDMLEEAGDITSDQYMWLERELGF